MFEVLPEGARHFSSEEKEEEEEKKNHKTFPRGSKDALAASATAGLPAGTRSFLPLFLDPITALFSPLLHFLSLVSALCFWFTYLHARSEQIRQLKVAIPEEQLWMRTADAFSEFSEFCWIPAESSPALTPFWLAFGTSWVTGFPFR